MNTAAYEKRDHLLLEHKNFYNSIINKTAPVVTLEDGLTAVRLIDQVLESVNSKPRGNVIMSGQSCLVIAGEKSGEEHALSFFKDLKNFSPGTAFFGVGGDDLKKEGLELLYHVNDFSSWGYSEVVTKIPFYIKAMNHIVAKSKDEDVKLRSLSTINLST